AAEKALAAVKAELADAKKDAELADKALAAAADALSAAEKDLADAKGGFEHFEGILATASDKFDAAQKALEDAQAQAKGATKAYLDADATVKDLLAKKNAAHNNAVTKAQELADAEQRVEELKQKVEKTRNDYGDAKQRLYEAEQAQKTIAEAKQFYKEFEKAKSDFTAAQKSFKDAMDTAAAAHKNGATEEEMKDYHKNVNLNLDEATATREHLLEFENKAEETRKKHWEAKQKLYEAKPDQAQETIAKAESFFKEFEKAKSDLANAQKSLEDALVEAKAAAEAHSKAEADIPNLLAKLNAANDQVASKVQQRNDAAELLADAKKDAEAADKALAAATDAASAAKK
ncbi:hypothetical protein, partial [Trueperella pyogenes]|uniref:hypothetical protein n=1 Tax=Trueperella pyogenes TaxID=1661 RepID=UPI0023DD98CC|nr:hypothetical protein [Trueperella pyogenes]